MFFSNNIFAVLSAMLAIALCAGTIIIGLDSIWRSKGRLKHAIIYIVLGLVPFLGRKVATFFSAYGQGWYLDFSQYADVISAFFFLMAAILIYKIIRTLDKEKKEKRF